MKNNIILLLLLCSIMLCSSQCKKTTTEITTTELDKLPAITQTGANTFGCLINGIAWMPKGADTGVPNSRLTIDNTTPNGTLTLLNYRILDNFRDKISFYSDSIKAVGTYPIKTGSKTWFTYGKYKPDFSYFYCEFDNSSYGSNQYNIDGYIKITKYDLVNKIYSGEFEVSFVNNTCEQGSPVKITAGRFDYKL